MDEIKKKNKLSRLVGCNSPAQELHFDLLVQVFVRLPIQQLLKCMFVSKFWCSIILQPTFIQAYCRRNPLSLLFSITQSSRKVLDNICEVSLRRSLYCSHISPSGPQDFFNLFNFSMFDSKQGIYSKPAFRGVTQIINGFFCAYVGNRVMLVNVFTGQVTDFLCPHIRPNAEARYFFGFEPISGLYKLLCVDHSNFYSKHPPESPFQDFYILTISGSDQEFSWRRLRFPEEDDSCFFIRRSFSVDGAVHWFHWNEDSICSFDLITEKFVYTDANVRRILIEEEIAPEAEIVPTGSLPYLLQFKGKLSLFFCKDRNMIIRSLEMDNSWTVHEATLPDEFLNPELIHVGHLSTGEILFAYPDTKASIIHVYAYDNKFERFVVGKFPQSENLDHLNGIYCVEQNIEMLEALFRRFQPRIASDIRY